MFFGEVAEQTVFSEWSRRFENRRPDFYINNLLTFWTSTSCPALRMRVILNWIVLGTIYANCDINRWFGDDMNITIFAWSQMQQVGVFISNIRSAVLSKSLILLALTNLAFFSWDAFLSLVQRVIHVMLCSAYERR